MKSNAQYRKEEEFDRMIQNAISTHTILSYENAKKLVGKAQLKNKEEYHAMWLRNKDWQIILPENPEEYYSNN